MASCRARGSPSRTGKADGSRRSRWSRSQRDAARSACSRASRTAAASMAMATTRRSRRCSRAPRSGELAAAICATKCRWTKWQRARSASRRRCRPSSLAAIRSIPSRTWATPRSTAAACRGLRPIGLRPSCSRRARCSIACSVRVRWPKTRCARASSTSCARTLSVLRSARRLAISGGLKSSATRCARWSFASKQPNARRAAMSIRCERLPQAFRATIRRTSA